MQAVTVSQLQLDRTQAILEAAKAAYEAAEHLASLIDEVVKDGDYMPNLLASYAWRSAHSAMMAHQYCRQLDGVEVAS